MQCTVAAKPARTEIQGNSKLADDEKRDFLTLKQAADCAVESRGLHCHLGSRLGFRRFYAFVVIAQLSSAEDRRQILIDGFPS